MNWDEANAKEWAEALELLAQVHAIHQELTLGEVVHLAAVLGEGESRWGAGVGAVANGLRAMLEAPAGARWNPDGTWRTPREAWRQRLEWRLDLWRTENPRPERPRGEGVRAWWRRLLAWEGARQVEINRWTAEHPRPEPTPAEVAEAEALTKLGAKIAGVLDGV